MFKSKSYSNTYCYHDHTTRVERVPSWFEYLMYAIVQ